jgi:ankyrin repeat protein
MPRKLRRYIQIDRKMLEERKAVRKFKNNKHPHDFIIAHSEEEFNAKCRENTEKIIVHYLIPKQNNLLWQKSSGPTSTLIEFTIRKDGEEESIEETEIFHKSTEKVLIISTEPGMGKSLILDHFTQNSSAENFFLKITLNTCTEALSDLKLQKIKIKNSDDLMDFVLKSLLQKREDQEIERLKNFALEGKLIFMFDGFDEVNDYKEQVLQLIAALDKDNRIKKILITTRNHLKEDLEDHFRTFSYNLNNFSDEDQKSFLFKYWRNSNFKRHERATSAKLKQSADDLITKIKSILSANINQLIGIPLQTKMMADIFIDREKDFSKIEITNFAELYHHFLETMVEVNFVNRKKIDPNKNQGLYKREKNAFYLDHIRLSYRLLFENSNDTSEEEFSDEEKRQEILEYGVVVAFTESKIVPTFLHQSFAEFFLAKSSFTKIEQNKDENDQELEQILRDERHFLIRKFLNDLMEKNEPKETKPKEENKKDFNEEMKNCCRENLFSLLKYFSEQKGATLRNQCVFLVIASRYGNKVIVEYLIENGIEVNQDNQDGESALYVASENGHKAVVQYLLEQKDINVNQRDKSGISALMRASNLGHNEIVQLLLKHKDVDVNLHCEDGFSALVDASIGGRKEAVQLLLDHKDIDVNLQSNKGGKFALFYASGLGFKEIVQLLLDRKDVNVNQQCNKGNTALIYASYNGKIETLQLLLNHKDIHDINQQNKVEETALWIATCQGHKEIVQLLLEHKDIDVNRQNDKYGSTALMMASHIGHRDIVQLLLDRKDVNVNQQNNKGYTALMYASFNGQHEMVQLLLERNNNIDVNIQNREGKTALMKASENGHREIVQLLLKHKEININRQDNKGQTALFVASEHGRKDIVELLLDRKELHDLNQFDNYGENVLYWASDKGHTEIVQLLLEKMQIPK